MQVAVPVRVDSEVLKVAAIQQLLVLLGCKHMRQFSQPGDVLLKLLHLLLQRFRAGIERILAGFNAEPNLGPGLKRKYFDFQSCRLSCRDLLCWSGELVDTAITIRLKLAVRIPIGPLDSSGDIPQLNLAFLPTSVAPHTQLKRQHVTVVDEQFSERPFRELGRSWRT